MVVVVAHNPRGEVDATYTAVVVTITPENGIVARGVTMIKPEGAQTYSEIHQTVPAGWKVTIT